MFVWFLAVGELFVAASDVAVWIGSWLNIVGICLFVRKGDDAASANVAAVFWAPSLADFDWTEEAAKSVRGEGVVGVAAIVEVEEGAKDAAVVRLPFAVSDSVVPARGSGSAGF